LEAGDLAPRFRVEDMQSGEAKGFDQIVRHQPLLLVLLQTACRSCVREMLAIKTIHKELGGFGLLEVLLDMHWGNLEPFIAACELPFVFAWDPSETIAKQYGVSVSPVAFRLIGSGRSSRSTRDSWSGSNATYAATSSACYEVPRLG
jgi:peroxiredoxin